MTANRGTIRLLVLDVDGVITDGTLLLLPSGDEVRSIHMRDLDAVHALHRDRLVEVAILSGEDTPLSHRIAARFSISRAVWGAKDKLAGLTALAETAGVPLDEICYVGDAVRDVPALTAAGLGIAPADASPEALTAADVVLRSSGGRGAVAEAVSLLMEGAA